MAEPKQRSCEERIGEELASRLEDFRRINELRDYLFAHEPGVDTDAEIDALADEHMEYPLHVETRRVVTILLSTGGPHDEFNVELDDDDEPTRITYRFLDWFDGAAVTLTGEDFDTAAAFLAPFVEAEVSR